jgi:hypothetical protein
MLLAQGIVMSWLSLEGAYRRLPRVAIVGTQLSLAAAAALLAVPSAARAADAGEYTFTVLKDGDPVGRHSFAFACQGDRIEIQEKTEIEVRLAMIPIYSFEHEARQLWENGQVVRIDATTNDNGEKLDITVRPNGHGYIRTVNGRVDRFDGSTTVLAFWNKDTLKHHAFFSAVEDKTLDASFQFVGRETMTLHGQQLDVEHYRMVGDEERDLWFDSAGRVVKVAFRRHGAQLEYVRDKGAPSSAAGAGQRC